MVEKLTRETGIKAALFGRTQSTFFQLIRYTFVGGVAFIVDFGTLYGLKEHLHIDYLAAAAVAFLLGLLVNYFISVRWVFCDRTIRNRLTEFAVFGVIGLFGLGLNELLLWIFTGILLIHYLISKLMTTFIVYFWNFFARKLILFNQDKAIS
jgi:putative flippase GtrA